METRSQGRQRTLSENSHRGQEELWSQPFVFVNPPELQGCRMNPGFVCYYLRSAPAHISGLTHVAGQGLAPRKSSLMETLLLALDVVSAATAAGRAREAGSCHSKTFAPISSCCGLCRAQQGGSSAALGENVYASAVGCNTRGNSSSRK